MNTKLKSRNDQHFQRLDPLSERSLPASGGQSPNHLH